MANGRGRTMRKRPDTHEEELIDDSGVAVSREEIRDLIPAASFDTREENGPLPVRPGGSSLPQEGTGVDEVWPGRQGSAAASDEAAALAESRNGRSAGRSRATNAKTRRQQ